MNISLILQMAADAEPGRIGLVCEARRWSYGDLLRAARGAALNISKSTCAHVALLDEGSEAAAIALFAAAIAGVPYVPLNYRLANADLGALLSRARSNSARPRQTRRHWSVFRRITSPESRRC